MPRIAVVQPEGHPFDTAAALDEAARRCAEAAEAGAGLVVFPEAWLGGYPWGLTFGTAVGGRSEAGRRIWQRYHASAIDVPGPETERLAELAREHALWLVVGVIERDTTHARGTLYCTLLYLSPEGRLEAKHRKLKPTAAERLIWGEGDGSTLPVLDTELGRLGGLICWENYMPMARMAMYGKGVQLYVAPTADARPRWQATLQHIAVEGRCFVLGCNQYVTRDMYPADGDLHAELADGPEVLCRGGSAIYAPDGRCIGDPLYDQPGMLVADLDLDEITRAQFDFDATGHYARPDVFTFTVDERRRSAVRYLGDEG